MRSNARGKEQRNFKRVLFIADLHCGHQVGMTPPDWWFQEPRGLSLEGKVAKVQRELWGFYSQAIDNLQPIDRLIVNGDAVDGKGDYSGGTEQRTTSMVEQCKMAAYCINYVKADKVLMTYGTAVHAGKEDDWEDVVAGQVDNLVEITGHAWPIVNGVQFDVKHKIGGSSIPHGRFTAIAKAKLWNTVWNSRAEQQPKAGVLIRSHVHYCAEAGEPGYWKAMTTPALQGFGSKYGVRQCSGTVDIGMVVFDVYDNGEYECQVIKAELPQQKVQPLEF